jgi:hypothetical protein
MKFSTEISAFLFLAVTVLISCEDKEISPFSSLRMKNDEILVSLDLKRAEWSKLLSINSIGSDAIVNFSKQHYGQLKCDYEFECYKYNILKNFGEVYRLFNSKDLGSTVSLELE